MATNRSESGADVFAIRAERAFDGETMLRDGVTLLIQGSRIKGVEPGSAPVPDGCRVTEFRDATILPGLIDMHVHLVGDSEPGSLDRVAGYTDEELDAVIAKGLRGQLAAGVTTVRDLGDRSWSAVEWRDRLASSNDATYPTIVASGPPITTRRGHCWFMNGEAEGPDELRAAVRDRVERRVDVVKIMTSGGGTTPTTDVLACQYSLDDVRLVVDEAHAAGLPVTAHAHALEAVRQVVAAGVDGIEHCTCLTESGVDIPDDLIEELAVRRVVVCPTLGRAPDAPLTPRLLAMMETSGRTIDSRKADAAKMHRGGVTMVSGLDAGINDAKPHGLLYESIGGLVTGGVSVIDALASATSLAADCCGLAQSKGRLREGLDADVLVVHGDVAADVSSLRNVSAVFVRGREAAGVAP